MIETVRMNKPRGHAPRLSVPYDPTRPRHARYWTDTEKAILRQHFSRKGGVDVCCKLLPERSRLSIYQTAAKLGLRASAQRAERRRIKCTPEIEARMREAWPDLTGRGDVTRFAVTLDVPKHWLINHAVRLGLTTMQKKEPPWSAAETALMSRVPLHDPHKAAQIFREHGFSRTPTAIMVRAKRLDLSRRYSATLSATAAARILGIDSKSITGLCIAGTLKAEKRPTKRLPQQGGDPWSIERAELRRYVIDQIAAVDIRKVDKVAFVDLLVTVGSDQEKPSP